MLVGFTGVPGSGKTFSANEMAMEYPHDKVYKYGFGHKIKEITLSLFPEWNYRHASGDLKEVIDENFGISPRRVQQIIGKSLLEINPNLWSDVLFRGLDHKKVDYNDQHILVTIDDIRFPQDFEAIKSRGGIMIGLMPGKGYKELDSDTMNYETEKHTGDLVRKCDHILINDYNKKHSTVIRSLAVSLREE